MRKFQIIFKCRACQTIHTVIHQEDKQERTALSVSSEFTLIYEKPQAILCNGHIGICDMICIQEVK